MPFVVAQAADHGGRRTGRRRCWPRGRGAGRSCSTKWATSTPRRRRGIVRMFDRLRRFRRPRIMATSQADLARADRGGAVPAGSVLPARRRDRCTCRRCASGSTTSRCWPSISSPGPSATAGRPGASRPTRSRLVRAYSWPGNVRQLENTLRRLVVTAPEDRDHPGRGRPVLGNQPAMEPLSGRPKASKLSASVALASAAVFRPARRGAAAAGAVPAYPARDRDCR